MDSIIFNDYISKRQFTALWERYFLGGKTDKRLGEDLHTFQKGRESIFKFSKANTLRKSR